MRSYRQGPGLCQALAGRAVGRAKKQRAAALLLAMLLLAALAGCDDAPHATSSEAEPSYPGDTQASSTDAKEAVYGSTPGNINNSGFVVLAGERVYFSTGLFGGAFFSRNPDGQDGTQHNKETYHYLNSVDGWIYYVNKSDNSSIWKMRPGVKEQTRLNSSSCSWLTVVDHWLYFRKHGDDSGIFKMRTDGTEETQLSSVDGAFLNVSDGWLYFVDEQNNYNLHKLQTDGTGHTLLTGGDAFSYVSVAEGWVYYQALNDDDSYSLCKMRTDWSERTKICDDSVSYINVADGWIYYVNNSDEQHIYKMQIDGAGRTRLNEDSCRNICIEGGWVYYFKTDNDRVYRVRTNGTDRQVFQ